MQKGQSPAPGAAVLKVTDSLKAFKLSAVMPFCVSVIYHQKSKNANGVKQNTLQ